MFVRYFLGVSTFHVSVETVSIFGTKWFSFLQLELVTETFSV